MNLSAITAKIHDISIIDIIQKFGVEIKKKGANYQTCCPFHTEKTPSFFVNEQKGIYKCFGCGKAGDAINFVMEYKGIVLWDAVKEIAGIFNITIPTFDNPEEMQKQEDEYKHKQSLYIINDKGKEAFLQASKSVIADEYINTRISQKMQEKFEVGYAPEGWHFIQSVMKDYKEELLLEAGLLNKKGGKCFDVFINRVIFPIHNEHGKIVGFSGRIINKDSDFPKYINSTESVIFKKSKELFGLFFAKKTIQNKGIAYITEGQTDVITMHENGIENVVAALGSAITEEHAATLSKYTNEVCFLMDADNAGIKAMHHGAHVFLKKGFSVYVALLPEGHDPDSYFKENSFFEFIKNKQEYIFYYSKQLMDNALSVGAKSNAIATICQLLSNLGDKNKTNIFAEELGKIYKPKKQWLDKIKELNKEREGDDDIEILPHGVDAEEFNKYGFFEHRNQYFFRGKEGIVRVSNFVMHPIQHIKSINDSRRLFEILNVFNYREVIDIDMNSMVSLQLFKKVVESLGNYLWEGTDSQFTRIKRKLYDTTQTCILIENLGWQKEGFFAWANGIWHNGFKEIDANGIIEFNNINYFIPAYSSIYMGDKTIYLSERKFKYIKGNLSFKQWGEAFIMVFGDNAKLAICYYLSSLFKDFIFNSFHYFPILNLFGPPGTGKSQMAWSMMCLFGEAQNPYNIFNGTKVGLAEHLAEFNNAFAWVDEYKNSVDYDKIEMLKSAYDGIGRKKGSIDKGKKTVTTQVNTAVILSGQEMPTADVALLKRVILLQFSQTEFNDYQKKNYDSLKQLEKKGLSYITSNLLNYRQAFTSSYFLHYDEVLRDMQKKLFKHSIEDRILRNMAIILASLRFFEGKIDIPSNYDSILQIACDYVVDQSNFILNSKEITTFWNIIEYLVDKGILQQEIDFRIENIIEVNTDEGIKKFDPPEEILFLKMSQIYTLYAKTARETGQNILPDSTLKYYLRTSNEFVATKRSVRFKNANTSALLFKYKGLKVNLMRYAGVAPGDDISSNDNSF